MEREGNCRRCFASINYNFCAPHVRFAGAVWPPRSQSAREPETYVFRQRALVT
jgi:hypothetical protein